MFFVFFNYGSLQKIMATLNNGNQKRNSHVGSNRQSRIRETYQSGELAKQNIEHQLENKRLNRHASSDISSKATKTNESCPKHRFHQLAERVRELQKEIVPDFLLYQLPMTHSPFSVIAANPHIRGERMSTYPYRKSISVNSGSSNSSISNQKFYLSSRILERAHEIPERLVKK